MSARRCRRPSSLAALDFAVDHVAACHGSAADHLADAVARQLTIGKLELAKWKRKFNIQRARNGWRHGHGMQVRRPGAQAV